MLTAQYAVDVEYRSQDSEDERILDAPRFMFHYSPRSNRESIQRLGLLKEHPEFGRIWNLQEAGVFLFACPLLAWDWQNSINKIIELDDMCEKQFAWDRDDDGLGGDVWVVDTSQLHLQTDEYIKRALRSVENIDPQHIKVFPEVGKSLFAEFSQLQRFKYRKEHLQECREFQEFVQALLMV